MSGVLFGRMKWWFAFAVALGGVVACALAVGTASGGPSQSGRDTSALRGANGSRAKIALVIGNGAYAHAQVLKNPANDAADIAAALKQLGFELIGGGANLNLTQLQMKRLIRELGERLRAGSQGLFYYAGHGVQVDGRNFMIPTDADIRTDSEFEDMAVEVKLVLGEMDDAGNGLNAVILDACRDDPFPSAHRSMKTRGLARMDAQPGTLIAYSTAPNKTAADGKGRNSPFAAALLVQMHTPGIPIEQVLKQVGISVEKQTGWNQEPYMEFPSTMLGEFYLGPLPDSAAESANAAHGNAKLAAEQEYWERIKSSTNKEDFSEYLTEYPNGGHVSVARQQLLQLTTSASSLMTDPILIPFLKGDKWGFSDVNRRLVIEAKYEHAEPFSEGLAAVWRLHTDPKVECKWGFVDKTGREVVPLKYNYAHPFSEGLAAVDLESGGPDLVYKWGFVDRMGQEVIPLKYGGAEEFHQGLAAVYLNGKWRLINKIGQEILPLNYDGAEPFEEGLALVELHRKVGFVDQTGREVIPLRYDGAKPFKEGFALVELNHKVGFVDQTGREIIHPKYDDAQDFKEGLALVKLNGKWGFIDKDGRLIVSIKYDSAESFREGLAAVELNSEDLKVVHKCGFVDQTGREVIPLRYDHAWPFSEGLGVVGLNGKWGFVDKIGREVIPLKYDDADTFSEGLAEVERNGKWGFIDKEGREVIPLKYDYIQHPFREGLAYVHLNHTFFYIDKNGTEYYEP